MAEPYEVCAWCPRLCRHVCPVAVGTGHESATPTAKMTAILLQKRGMLDAREAGRAAALCTDCGACTTHCHFHVEVGRLLAEARARLLPVPGIEPLSEIAGDARHVAIICDERSWSGALAHSLGRPVASLVTHDHLGALILDHPASAGLHMDRLSRLLRDRDPVSACGACIRVLRAAGLEPLPLHALMDLASLGPWLPATVFGDTPAPAVADALTNAGSGARLAREHPWAAEAVSREAARRVPDTGAFCLDSAESASLRRAGARVTDPVDLLLASMETDP